MSNRLPRNVPFSWLVHNYYFSPISRDLRVPASTASMQAALNPALLNEESAMSIGQKELHFTLHFRLS